MNNSINIYYFLSIFMFFAGAFGVVKKRNLLSVLMAIEIMFLAINLLLVILSKMTGEFDPIVTFGLLTSLNIIEMVVGIVLIYGLSKKHFNIIKDNLKVILE